MTEKTNYLKEFQAANGLVADGVLGKKTALAMMEQLGITSKIEFAHFLAQMAHESADFTAGRENLNYSAEALQDKFGKYFKPFGVEKYARQPEKIANRIYAKRMGNGFESSGDGWRYRGVGPIQLTGKGNIQGYFKSVGLPPDTDPNAILEPEHYFNSAKYFFDVNDVWKNCRSNSAACCLAVSRQINLGSATSKNTPMGMEDRLAKTAEMMKILQA